jgi:hypothetical protein
VPTRRAALVFALKAMVHRTIRSWHDAINGDVRRWPQQSCGQHDQVWGEARSPLFSAGQEDQRQLVLGKVENLRVALRAFHGVEVPANGTFSFWAQLGRPVARRGFVPGRELREGCIIPTIGGGLCQISNALYQAALDAGLEIVERRGHSQVIDGSAAQAGRDATVFWNYVDLRFRSTSPMRIEAVMDGEQLRVRILKAESRVAQRKPLAIVKAVARDGAAPASCDSCNEHDCFRRVDLAPMGGDKRTVFMVDAVTPEFDAWVSTIRKQQDTLLLPLQGRAQYGWNAQEFAKVRTFPLLTLWRALASRMAGRNAAARQALNLRWRQRFAHAYAKSLHYLDEHVVVTQELLPYLWESGALQGRSFDVLMTTLPIGQLQQQLDQANKLHPASTTLGDFRAPVALLALEAKALREARSIITPHARLAAQYRNAVLLPWALPRPAASLPRRGHRIVFPAATLGRKGAYELRHAARTLDIPLTLMGPVLEAADFWQGIDIDHAARGDAAWLEGVGLVVLPAWVEGRPVALLQALQAGVPVIATHACGLPPQENLTLIDAGDVDALIAALQDHLAEATGGKRTRTGSTS